MSEKDLMTILIGVGLFIVFGGPIIYLVRHKMKISRVWKALAENSNLTLEEGRFPVVSGKIDGRYFEMGSAIGRKPFSGEASHQQLVEFYGWTEIMGAVPEGFAAGKRGLMQGPGPVQTDSSAFNKKIWVDSVDKSAAKAYLTPERQGLLLELIKYNGEVYGPQGDVKAHVVMNKSGYKVKLSWLEERKNVLLKTAQAFDN